MNRLKQWALICLMLVVSAWIAGCTTATPKGGFPDPSGTKPPLAPGSPEPE